MMYTVDKANLHSGNTLAKLDISFHWDCVYVVSTWFSDSYVLWGSTGEGHVGNANLLV